MDEFFLDLGKDVQNLYHKMCNGNNIYETDTHGYLGASMNTRGVDNPCMVLQYNEYSACLYFTLAHEMGHCYQFYLQRNELSCESFNITTEVTSLLFEKLFRDYLENRKIFLEVIREYDLENHIYLLNDLSAAKVLCYLFNGSLIGKIDAYDLTYETIFTIDDLREMMVSDCGYIMPNKRDLELTEIHYAIGNIMASHFAKKINEDKINGWKEFKNFISMVNYLPIEEILEKYLDISLVQQDIKKFMKSYRGR